MTGIMKQKKRREVYKIYYNIEIREIEGGKEGRYKREDDVGEVKTIG